jgi:hypothetical protein
MGNPAAQPTQQYIALWRKCKAEGGIPAVSPTDSDVITSSTTIREILHRMERTGKEFEANKTVDTRTVVGVATRKFWVIPGPETPSCVDLESGDDVDSLASIKFIF